MKQTAVEFLEEKIKDIFYVAEASEMNKMFQIFYQQAKEMEKQQQGYSEEDLEKAFYIGVLYQGREGDTTFEKWFEQFKNK